MKNYTVKTLVIAILLLILLGGLLYWFNDVTESIAQKMTKVKSISNFEQCAKAGYPVQESIPRVCRVPKGKTFTER